MWPKFFAIMRKYLPLFVLLDIGLALFIGNAAPFCADCANSVDDFDFEGGALDAPSFICR